MADKLFKDYFNERQEDNAIQGNTKILIKRGNNVRKIDVDKFATAAQGSLADTAVQPSDLGTMAYEDADDYVDLTSNQRIGGFKEFEKALVGSVNTGQNSLKLWSLRGRTYQSGDQFMGVYMVGLSGSNSLVLGGGTGSVKGATKISFQTNPNSELLGSNERMVIDGNGNVGIGTDSPSAKLDIDGGNSSYTSFKVQGNGNYALYSYNDGGGVGIKDSSGANIVNLFYIHSAGNNARIYTNGSEKVRIASTGNVGIGTTSPTAKLDVDGNTKITGTLDLNDGSNRTIIGTQAGGSGALETSLGYQAGQNTSQMRMSNFGYQAGRASNSVFGTFIGYQAGQNSAAGNSTAVGYQAGYFATGFAQTAIGIEAGSQNTGSQNIAIGRISSLQNSGDNVISIGISATRSNSGNNILALGNNAAQNNTQSNRTIINNDLLPAFASFALAEAAFGTGQAGMTYLYFNTITNAIEGVRF